MNINENKRKKKPFSNPVLFFNGTPTDVITKQLGRVPEWLKKKKYFPRYDLINYFITRLYLQYKK